MGTDYNIEEKIAELETRIDGLERVNNHTLKLIESLRISKVIFYMMIIIGTLLILNLILGLGLVMV